MAGLRSSRKLPAAGLALFIVVGAVWGLSTRLRTGSKGPAVPKELRVASLKAQSADPDKLMDTMRNAYRRDDLTEEQRRQVRSNLREVWTSMIDERIDEYFGAAPNVQASILDKHIDEFQQRRKGWEKRRKEFEKERKARQAREGGDGESREARRSGDRRRFGSRSRTERKARSENRNPDKQVRRMAYFAAIRKRMSERGIQMRWRGPGSRGRGRRPG